MPKEDRKSKQVEQKDFMFLNKIRIPMDIISEIYCRWVNGGKPDNFTVEVVNRIIDSETSWDFNFVCEFVDEKGYSGNQHGVISNECDCNHCINIDKIKGLSKKELKEDLQTIDQLIEKPISQKQKDIDLKYKEAIIKQLKKVKK